MSYVEQVRDKYSARFRSLFDPVTRAIERSGITPNMLTVMGLSFAVAVGFLVWYEYFIIAAIVFTVGSLMDMLDGAVARLTEKVTPLGAFMDSTFDRLGEGIVLTSIALVFAREGDLWAVGATFATMVGSFLVSYTRARAEALGLDCKVGLMTRAERIVLVAAGLFLARFGVLEIVMYILAVLTAVTVLQRVLHVRRQYLKSVEPDDQAG